MIYETIDELNDRYLAVVPMPNMTSALKGVVAVMDAAEQCWENVREECAGAIAYYEQTSEKFTEGKLDGWTETDMERLRGESDMAWRVLRALGYEIDHYFCGTPVLKPIDPKEES